MNAVIGSGIFLLPGKAAAVLGPAALLALLLAGLFSLLVALCFAEVGSRFDGTGGAYLYTREAFGPWWGFQVGWISWVVRVISWAALAAGVARAGAAVWPALTPDPVQRGVAAAVLVFLSLANAGGARLGAGVINVVTVFKMAPLLLFLVVGAFFVDPANATPFAPFGFGGLGEATLLVLWAFAGFENVAVIAGETRDAARVVPHALLAVMGVVLVLYVAVFLVALGTHPQLAGATAPVADAAAAFMGPWGGALIGLGIAVSVFGTTAGTALIVPRFLWAMANDGHLPAVLARLHPRFHTPLLAIVLSTALSLVLVVSGTFERLVVISVVARFAQFIPTCLAVLVFRARDRPGQGPGFRIPFGPVIPVVTVLFCAGLLAQAPRTELMFGALAIMSGVPIAWFQRRTT